MNAQLPRVEASWPAPGDPAAAKIGLDRWHDRAREIEASNPTLAEAMRGLAEDAPGAAMLTAIFGGSPFLGTLALRDPAILPAFVDHGPDALFAEVLAKLATETDGATDRARVGAALRRAKRHAALVIAAADIGGLWPLVRVTGALTLLAERALDAALAHILRHAATRGLIRTEAATPERSGFIVLGMGKLGGGELNYSSDIDLIVLFDPARDAATRPDETAQIHVRLTRELVALMDERTAEGYVFRVDMRLRPDAGATPVAIALPAAETYYTSMAQNWERAAMIKARPVAGDRAAGQAFLDFLTPFVWRKSLDFAAIRDIRAIKRQIHDHRGHGATAASSALEGFDVKLGPGGIRQIEFFVQAQQMIWGGREPTLRVRPSMEALAALVAAGRVDPGTAVSLRQAYETLRAVEHRIQMVDDRQTHALPTDRAAFDRLARFLGLVDGDALRAELRRTLEAVEAATSELLGSGPADGADRSATPRLGAADERPETLEALKGLGFARPTDVVAIVRGLRAGRYRALRSERARDLFERLLPRLLDAFGRTADPDAAFARFDRFIAGLPSGVQLFSLFDANPDLFDLVAEILGVGGRLASHLAETPRQLDAVLTRGFFGPLPTREECAATLDALLATARGYEDALDLLRRWTHDERFRAGVHLLRALSDGATVGRFLGDVAELGLAAALDHTQAVFAERHGSFGGPRFAILGMGKLAGREMSVRSDLDLVMIYELDDLYALSDNDEKPLTSPTYHLRLTQRVVAAITAKTAEGALYEIDMRLRPSGSTGPLAVSIEAFERYQRQEAWTWEHMALTRARPIAGPPALKARIDALVHDILATPRDPAKLLHDVADMRLRIDGQHHTDDPWDLKYVRGGQIDIEFIAQYLQLRHAATAPQILSPNTGDALDALAAHGVLDGPDHAALSAAHRLYQTVQGFLRLTLERPADMAEAPPALQRSLGRILAQLFGDPSLETDPALARTGAAILAGRQRRIGAIYERIIGPLAAARVPT